MTPLYFTDDNPASAVAVLQDTFPEVPIWYGNHTRHYWAMVGGQFLEAPPIQPSSPSGSAVSPRCSRAGPRRHRFLGSWLPALA